MIDEFQDTNAVQLGDPASTLERDNLFAVGDEFQSIYRFRHADVGIFRKRAQRPRGAAPERQLPLPRGAAGRAQRGVRARVRRAVRAAAGRPQGAVPMDDDGALRLFSLDPPRGSRPSSCSSPDTQGWDELAPRLGLAQGGDQPWRRAEARLTSPPPARRRLESGRRAGDIVVLVRATSSPAAARGGAGGAGPADLRRRRPRLLVARSRSATASRGCACSRTRTTRRRC